LNETYSDLSQAVVFEHANSFWTLLESLLNYRDQRPFQEAAPLLALEDTMVETEARNSSNREFAREQACGRPSPRTRRNIARL
ncbi:hypothetical protein KCU98_g247, partial [Aureobasidium melanogenum]